MATEEQYRSGQIDPSDGNDDDSRNEQDGDTSISSSSSTSQTSFPRRSRFFRTKRRQRDVLESSQPLNSNSDQSNESVNSSESPEQSDESVLTESNSIVEKISWRPSSPPPPPVSNDDADESSRSMEELEDSDETLKQQHRKIIEEKKILSEPRPSLPTIFGGYTRKKSQSVKLTRIDPIDSCQKKAVRFADDFGLDLSQVKVIKSDELPHVPIAAFKDLHINHDDLSSTPRERTKIITYLEQKFDNPLHTHAFDDRVLRHKIVLEQANAIDNRIYGTIKLFSLGMNKRVKIRLSTDNWISYQDYDASYILNSFDGTFDRFSFTLEIDRDRICPGNSVQFCLSYDSYTGSEFWDSNYQQNYRFECVSRTIPDYSS